MKYLSKFLSLFLVGAMLYATGCTDYDQDIKDLNNKVDELEQTLQGQIDPLKTDLEAVQTALEQAIKDGEALKAKHEEDVKALQDADAKAQEAIDAALKAIEEGDAELDKKIADAVKAIEEANKKIADLEAVDAEIKENLKTLEDSLKGTQADVESLKVIAQQLIAWSANVDGSLAAMNTEIEGINEALESLEGDVESLKVMIQQHDTWITNAEGRLGNLEEYKAYADEQFELLAKADKDLNDLVANLRGDFEKYQETVAAEFVKAYAAIGENTTKIDALTADLEAKYNALVAADKAMQDAIAQHEQWITNAEARIAALQEDLEEVQSNLEDLQADYDEFKGDVTTRLRNAEGSIGQLQVDVQGLNDKLDEFKADYDEHIAAYEEFVKKTNDAIANMQDIIEAIIGRVQSIVFVPEYTDGEATIDYATFGDKGVIEGRSTLEYQVYPAECALAIKAENLTYDVVGVKTRASESLKVVDVKGDADGRLFVTVVANLGQEFYNGQVKDYAASLVLASETANLSTEYVGLYPAKTAAENITMDIVYDDKIVTDNMAVYNVELEYANIEADPDHIAMAGYYLVFNLNGKQYTKAELAEYGYVVNPVRGNLPFVPYPEATVSIKKNDETGYGEFWLNITKVDSSLVGKTYSFTYDYYYDESKTNGVAAACSLTIIKEQAKADMGTYNAHWLYSKDAAVDAGQSSMYVREFVVENITEVEGFELPSDKEWADIVGNKAYTPTITIKNAAGAVVNDVTALIYAKDGDVLVSFTNFKWDETYTIEATYSFDYIDATVTFTVATEDRNRERIEINFEQEAHMFEANLQLTTEYSDPMDTVFAALTSGDNKKYYDITCDDYLAANFVVNYDAVDTIVADGKTINGANDTLLAIDEVNGAKVVYTAYSYADFDFVPSQVEYTKTITTWYGQEVVLNKVLNFEFPVYDFKHNSKYVDGADYNYFSQVQPEYTWDVLEENGLLTFDVAAVKLPVAFEVVDANGKKLSDAEMAALSLTYDFIITDDEHDGISIDPATKYLSYYGGKPSVNVRGEIVITNKNGTKYVVPTSFDQGGIYESYKVLKFNPVGIAKIKDDKHPVVDVTNSQDYTIDVLDYIELKDVRTSGRDSYDLIVDGEWVVGNGTNGFAKGAKVIAGYMYNIEVFWDNDLSDVDAEVQPYLSFENGTLKFDNKHQIELTSPFTVPVKLTFTNPWMEKPQQVTVNVTFNPIK